MDHRSASLDSEFHRLARELNDRGMESLKLDATFPEAGIVDSVLEAIDLMRTLLHITHGWSVPAAKLRPGMTVENCGRPADEPEVLRVSGVVPWGSGMVRIRTVERFLTRPVASDCPFELIAPSRVALEEAIV